MLRHVVALALMGLHATFVFAQNPVKLGFIAAQSGPLGVLGAEQKRGFDLALEHLGNKLGGLPVSVYNADSKSSPTVAVQEVSKLVDKDTVDLITGVTASNEIMAVVKPITSAGVFFVGSNGGPSPLAGKECNPNYFNVSFQNDQWSEGMGQYMAKQGVERPYFIGMDYQAGWDHIGGAERGLNRDTVPKVFTPQAQLDFSASLAQVRAAKPDGVFAFYAGGPAVAFVKQYAQAGLKSVAPLYSNMGLIDTLSLPAFGDNAVGVIVSGHYSTQLDNAANKRFVADYREKHGRDPSTFASQQYDAVMLIDSAVRAVDGNLADKDRLREALRRADFHSVRGDFKFNNNHMPIHNIYVQRVEKRTDGELYLKLIGVASEHAKDIYSKDCPMKW